MAFGADPLLRALSARPSELPMLTLCRPEAGIHEVDAAVVIVGVGGSDMVKTRDNKAVQNARSVAHRTASRDPLTRVDKEARTGRCRDTE